MHVELVHEWLTNLAGSEKVAGALRRAFPGAGLSTSLYYAPEFPGWDPVRTTFLQPFATRRGAHLRVLPLIPPAMHTLRVPDADLVITSFHSFALNARVPRGTPHIVYCHTPPRFLWEREQLAGERGLSTGLTGAAAAVLQPGDRRRSRRPDLWVANSTEVQGRIRAAYGRDAEVVHPPVEVERFAGALGEPEGDYFVSFSRVVAYKRVDLVVEAFRELGWPLVVAGEGRARAGIEATAPDNVRFVGRVPDEDLPALLAGARGLVFAGVEDFGITMVEAMAAGTPVIALDAGGARDSVLPGRSGLLFAEPTVASLTAALQEAAATDWDRADVSASARRFTEARFADAMRDLAASVTATWATRPARSARTPTTPPLKAAPARPTGACPHPRPWRTAATAQMAVSVEGPLVAINGTRDAEPRGRRRRQPLSPWSLRVVADLAAVMVGLAVIPSVGWANLLYAAGVFVTLGMVGTYRRHLALSTLSELPRLLLGAGIPLLFVGSLAPFTDLPSTLFDQVAMTGVAVVVGRTLTYAVIRTARRAGQLQENALIVGAGAVGIELSRLLKEHPEYGLVPVGFIDDVPSQPGLELLGGMADLEKVIHEQDVRRVLVAFGPRGEQELVATLRSTGLHDVELHVVPRFFELGFAPGGPDVEHVWGIPLFQVRRAALRAGAWKAKRVVDVVVAALLLLLLAPLLGLLALAVRLSSPGPILFRQRRIGQHGREIEVLKFRTLRVNTDADVTWSVEDDPRQTSVGKWLRRLSLDELPQFWNVLRGDMSLVGPRPERPHFVSRFSAQVTHYADRHRLPVGLTGLAQIHGLRGDTSIEERARFDNYYIEHWSPWEDVKVMIATVGVILRDALRSTARSDRPARLRAERRARKRDSA